MRRRLLAVALAVLAALASGCATKSIAGKPTFGVQSGSTSTNATGLAAEPLDEIVTAVQKFAMKQQSVHINAQVDGKLFSDADLSFVGAQGVTTVEKKQVQFRTIGEKTYVRDSGSGNWSNAGADLGETIRGQTKFQDIIQEVSALKANVKSAKPKAPDLIALSDGEGNEIDVANDPDAPSLQAFHLKTASTKNDIVLSDWSEESLHLQTPAVS